MLMHWPYKIHADPWGDVTSDLGMLRISDGAFGKVVGCGFMEEYTVLESCGDLEGCLITLMGGVIKSQGWGDRLEEELKGDYLPAQGQNTYQQYLCVVKEIPR